MIEKNFLKNNRVASLYKTKKGIYCKNPPFNPPEAYPEYPYDNKQVQEDNNIYAYIRILFKMLQLDQENVGTESWNPLGEIIAPWDKVVIKPALTNSVNYTGDSIFAIMPHGSIIRAVLDYVLIANPKKVTICDGPIPNAAFKDVCDLLNLSDIVDHANSNQSIKVDLIDLRDEYAPKDDNGKIIDIMPAGPDPLGYSIVDLGQDSMLKDISDGWMKYRSVSSVPFERFAPPLAHNKISNKYSISNTVLNADVIINIPKLKTHRKVGISVALKNVVGITNKKYELPHFRVGIDDCPASTKRGFKKHIQLVKEWSLGYLLRMNEFPTIDGNWPGNDTTWRSAIDLFRIMMYSDTKGILHNKPQRKHFAVVDGIYGGEGFGPLAPTVKKSGVLIAGTNPVCVDTIAADIIGLNPKKLKIISGCYNLSKYELGNFVGVNSIDLVVNNKDKVMPFKIPKQWHNLRKKS